MLPDWPAIYGKHALLYLVVWGIHCVLNPSNGVLGRFDLATLCGCHTLNVCCVMICSEKPVGDCLLRLPCLPHQSIIQGSIWMGWYYVEPLVNIFSYFTGRMGVLIRYGAQLDLCELQCDLKLDTTHSYICSCCLTWLSVLINSCITLLV